MSFLSTEILARLSIAANSGHILDSLVRLEHVFEGVWEERKHPRGGFPQNVGEFSPKWGERSVKIDRGEKGEYRPSASKIHSAAIRDKSTGEIATGKSHAHAYIGRARPGEDIPAGEWDEGFVTTEGLFVDRPTAAKIAGTHEGESQLIAGKAGQEIRIAERLKKLRLPPAWTDVRLSIDENSPLQATGKDAKGRTQYVYSVEHSEKKAAEKFARVKEFVGKLPAIREKLKQDLNSGNPAEEAMVLWLIDKTGFRVGSDTDTQAKAKAFGASTLLGSHVRAEGGKLSFDFIGKKGVRIQQQSDDPVLVEKLGERAGREGKLFNTNDAKVRDYLHGVAGDFKVKDFRTAVAGEAAMKAIAEIPAPKNAKEYVKSRAQVGKMVAAKLGNTPSVALASYIPPEVFESWQANLMNPVPSSGQMTKMDIPSSKSLSKTRTTSAKANNTMNQPIPIQTNESLAFSADDGWHDIGNVKKWMEEKHPRGQPENKGEFREKGSSPASPGKRSEDRAPQRVRQNVQKIEVPVKSDFKEVEPEPEKEFDPSQYILPEQQEKVLDLRETGSAAAGVIQNSGKQPEDLAVQSTLDPGQSPPAPDVSEPSEADSLPFNLQRQEIPPGGPPIGPDKAGEPLPEAESQGDVPRGTKGQELPTATPTAKPVKQGKHSDSGKGKTPSAEAGPQIAQDSTSPPGFRELVEDLVKNGMTEPLATEIAQKHIGRQQLAPKQQAGPLE